MNDTRRTIIEGLRNQPVPEPPADLLETLQQEIPAVVRAGDPDRFRRASYFDRASPMIAAASIFMMFSFTLLVARIILTNEAERELPTITRSAPEATKISDSAAEEAPVGAAARRRPPAVEPVQDHSRSAAPAAERNESARPATGTAAAAGADPELGSQAVESAGALKGQRQRPGAASRPDTQTGVAELDRAARPATQADATSSRVEETRVGTTRAEAISVTPDDAPAEQAGAGEPATLQAAPAAPPPAPAVGQSAARFSPGEPGSTPAGIRPVHAPRLEKPLDLPETITASFILRADGSVVEVRIIDDVRASTMRALRMLLRTWQFPIRTGAADDRVVQLIIPTDELQPLGDQ